MKKEILYLPDISAALSNGNYQPSRTTIMNMVKNGQLPKPKRMGKRLIWPRSEVELAISQLIAPDH